MLCYMYTDDVGVFIYAQKLELDPECSDGRLLRNSIYYHHALGSTSDRA